MGDPVHAVGWVDEHIARGRGEIRVLHDHPDGAAEDEVQLVKLVALVNGGQGVGVGGVVDFKLPPRGHLVVVVPEGMSGHGWSPLSYRRLKHGRLIAKIVLRFG
jgi:hypothetical protein